VRSETALLRIKRHRASGLNLVVAAITLWLRARQGS
jgi:hypothetical protein